MIDLTTLEGADTPGKVRSLSPRRARPTRATRPPRRSAAVCVYGDMVADRRCEALGGQRRSTSPPSPPRSPAGGRACRSSSPTPRTPSRPAPTRSTWSSTAARSSSGRYLEVFDEIVAVKEACAADGTDAHLKVILETGELVTYDNVRRASWLAMLAGGDFIKTSTGKVSPAATLPVTLLMLEAVRDWRDLTGEMVGVKPAGGIRTTKDAIKYLVIVNETAGEDWLDPDLVPLRRLQPAQRPAAAAPEAGAPAPTPAPTT